MKRSRRKSLPTGSVRLPTSVSRAASGSPACAATPPAAPSRSPPSMRREWPRDTRRSMGARRRLEKGARMGYESPTPRKAPMESLAQLLDVFLHLDAHLAEWSGVLGPWLYAVLFLIVFCETGLVVTPFLPGDSLLFAAGALCALDGSPLAVAPLAALLVAAAVAGG